MQLAEPPQERMALEKARGAGLEEGAPARVDGLGRGQVLGEQLLDEAAVQIVKLVGFHSLC
jgi:hypothetical protein